MASDDNKTSWLINPVSLQAVMTHFCRSGYEVPRDPVSQPLTPVGSVPNGSEAEGAVGQPDLEARERRGPQLPDPTEVEGPAIRCSVLLTKDGNFMSQSKGLSAEDARLYSALTSKLWENQVTALNEIENEIANMENPNEGDRNERQQFLGPLKYFHTMLVQDFLYAFFIFDIS